MPQNEGYGIFGPTPYAVRQAQINERLQQAHTIGSLSPGGHGALAGGAFGRAAGALFGQAQDPRLKQAQTLQDIEAEMSQMGLEPGTPEFTKTLGQLMMTRMGPAAAAQAVSMARQLEIQRAEVDAIRNPPEVAAARGRARALQEFAGMSPAAAEILAPMKEVSDAVLKGALSPAEVDAKVRQALFATDNNIAAARRLVAKDFEKAPGVYIDQRSKLANIRDEVLTREGAKAEAGKKISLENAGPVLKEYVELLKNPPPMTDFGAMVQWLADVKAKEGTAGQAYARLANPTGIVTDKDVEQAIKNLPGIGNYAKRNIASSIESLEAFTGMKFGGATATTPSLSPEAEEQVRKALNLSKGTKILSIERVK